MRKGITIISVIAALVIVAVIGFAVPRGVFHNVLVDSDWLENRLNRQSVLVIDTGRSLGDYKAGHIPGAVYLDRAAYYGQVGSLSGMFTGVDEISDALREIGVSKGKQIVVYDNSRALWSTRLFWTLEYLGHRRVSVLDGGFAKWTEESRQLAKGSETVARGNFTPRVNEDLVATGDWITQNLSSNELLVLDTRSVEEYNGTDVRAARGGHIPDAVNIEWTQAITDEAPHTFLPINELEELYATTSGIDKGKEIVTHCQTGVRGAHSYFVLRYLGYRQVKLYDASWVEWGNDDRFPIVGVAQ